MRAPFQAQIPGHDDVVSRTGPPEIHDGFGVIGQVAMSIAVTLCEFLRTIMRQLTYVGPKVLEWWDVPAPRLLQADDALVEPLAVTRCDPELLIIVGGASGLPGPFAIGHEAAGRGSLSRSATR